MLLFAHLGLTLAAGKLASHRYDINMAFLALGSILPDLIDKPFGYLLFGAMGNGRTVAHTLVFLLSLISISYLLNNKNLMSLSMGMTAHLVLDAMWSYPVVLFWPLLGDFPHKAHLSIYEYILRLAIAMREPYMLIPEVVGLAYLIYLLIHNKRLKRSAIGKGQKTL